MQNGNYAIFSLVVTNTLPMLLAVMPVQLKLGAEAALAKRACVDTDERQLVLKAHGFAFVKYGQFSPDLAADGSYSPL